MSENTETKYSYKGVPLTPGIIEELIEELFTGKLIVRQTIVDEVVKYHEKNGGAKASAQDVPRSVKKALENLREKGIADNPSYGFWRINSSEEMEVGESGEGLHFATAEAVVDPIADKVIGEGNSAVYVYYLPMYRQKAESASEKMWHCKIGKTDRDPLLRVLSQAATALPEKPHIALIIKTNLPSELETAIHGTLKIRGRKIDTSPGSEWFLTSPEEVEKIAEFIFGTKEAPQKVALSHQ